MALLRIMVANTLLILQISMKIHFDLLFAGTLKSLAFKDLKGRSHNKNLAGTSALFGFLLVSASTSPPFFSTKISGFALGVGTLGHFLAPTIFKGSTSFVGAVISLLLGPNKYWQRKDYWPPLSLNKILLRLYLGGWGVTSYSKFFVAMVTVKCTNL